MIPLPQMEATRRYLQCPDPSCTCHHPAGFVHAPGDPDGIPHVIVVEQLGKPFLQYYDRSNGKDEAPTLIKVEPAPQVIQPEPKKPLILVGSESVHNVALKDPRFVTGVELEAMNFPEPKYLITGILAEGYTLLAGRPKLGKSWLTLYLAIAVASGGYALGKSELRADTG